MVLHFLLRSVLSLLTLLVLAGTSMAQSQHAHGPALIIDNDGPHAISVSLYDDHHHKVGDWSVGPRQRTRLTQHGENVRFEGHYEIHINGASRHVEEWAQRDGNDWVLHYDDQH